MLLWNNLKIQKCLDWRPTFTFPPSGTVEHKHDHFWTPWGAALMNLYYKYLDLKWDVIILFYVSNLKNIVYLSLRVIQISAIFFNCCFICHIMNMPTYLRCLFCLYVFITNNNIKTRFLPTSLCGSVFLWNIQKWILDWSIFCFNFVKIFPFTF